MRKLYFGGGFPAFDVNHPEDSLKDDFRALVLGDVRKLLYLPQECTTETPISDNVSYVGPYFFYGEEISAKQVVNVENDMIHRCTDAVFLLENVSSPGTITEVVNAAILGKNVHIFYVSLDNGIPETEINSDQWYPIAFAQMVGKNVHCTECSSREEAVRRTLSFVESLK